MSLGRFLKRDEFSALFACVGSPTEPHGETERQADQRVAEELRDERYRSTLRNPPATDTGD